MDTSKVEDWLGTLLQTRSPDIYRMKGVMTLASDTPGCLERLVYQGVHDLYSGEFMGMLGEILQILTLLLSFW